MRTGLGLALLTVAANVCPACSFQAWTRSGVGRAAVASSAKCRTRALLMSEAPASEAPAVPAAPASLDVKIAGMQETAGGFISHLEVHIFRTVTTHKIIIAKANLQDLSERTGKPVDVEQVLKHIVEFMVDKKMPLDNTEGMIDAGVFPVNYFTAGQLAQFHPELWDKLAETLASD
ncbi:hypothetical protein JKP88DRAFT_350782 [Tribonema minus]|uniref:Uncharacterized protein n=1 Tax=Tribonema minus TaxID=303371 RepID=A0A835YV54_9STRA|nr:hypothetical protein JKP88DRAFT_350782 [Tribonema minus]